VSPRVAALACLLGVAGCGPAYDPLSREGLYYPTHTNHQNLTLMVANPADLVRGTGSASADGQLAAAAVDRLRTDKVKKLPASDIATLSAGTSGDNSSSGSGAP
jgi:type IV pilus biogenesis protein CpaD/CtpE